jgi:NAD(P)-dependent dehydrogenase (short-subunit alcohol dehydrogenase family)
VGGTSGIAESTVKSLCFFAVKPFIYLVGRNEESANRIISELRDIESDGTYTFIKKDVSLLENVDQVCMEINQKEKKVNLLFMTCGIASMKGRNETSEGIDKKLATNFYSRMRFAQQLMPLLEAAHPQLSRVISVLSPGEEKMSFDPSDIGLKSRFSLMNAVNHATVMTDFYFEQAAKQHPTVSFIHSNPGAVSVHCRGEYAA